ncbi:hypothetical protein GCM10017600_64510 [Streptosporangium carneum]|uniref:ASPIC/UnbV domain-containing protein n=1 Tax=Streptosporangium carneum TaxID=47481 RepID=A0A9W6I8T6_9ACTN|nr:hypothetical protein GCM10017600_64510 [Streptosporangium carneum]
MGASGGEPRGTATGFSFVAAPLGPPDRPGDRRLRPVAPGYENVRAWVSATGAAVALFDVDGEIVSDDVCLVDPRHDTVTVSPAPGTRRSYRPFTLAAPGRGPHEAPMGCLPADLDQDGAQDLVVYYWGRSPSLFTRVPGTPPSGAAFRHRDLTRKPEIWNTAAAAAGDFDGDGRLDLVFGNYFPDGVRVLDDSRDRGDAVMPGSLSNAGDGGLDRLYLGRGDGAFDAAAEAFDEVGGTGWTLALGVQDLDGDGRPELYVVNDFGPDRLLVNESEPGEIRFRQASGTRYPTTPRSAVLGEDSFRGRGVAFTDLNADGAPDVLVGNTSEPGGAYERGLAFVSRPDEPVADGLHDGEAPYDDHAEELGLSRAGWSWDVKAADFDNDGGDEVMYATGFVRGGTDRLARLREAAMSNDLAVSDPALWPGVRAGDDLAGHDANGFLTRDAQGRYVDVAGPAGVGADTVSRAFAVGDVDDDGRLDFAVANQWAASALYRNHGVTAPFVGLRLRLPAGRCGGVTGGITGTATSTTTGAVTDGVPGTATSAVTNGAPGTATGAVTGAVTGGVPSTATGAVADGSSAFPGSSSTGRLVRPGPASARPPLTRPAVGAAARVRLPGGVTLARQLYPSGGHNGVSAPELLFGLGDDAEGGPVPVELSWRDACGVPRAASISLEPGWHHLLLTDGGVAEMERP